MRLSSAEAFSPVVSPSTDTRPRPVETGFPQDTPQTLETVGLVALFGTVALRGTGIETGRPSVRTVRGGRPKPPEVPRP